MAEAQAQRQKHVPMRTCVVCRDKTGKRQLVRLVYAADGLKVDPTGKLAGRGAYLCEREECWQRVITSEVLAKALRVTLTADDRERLKMAKP